MATSNITVYELTRNQIIESAMRKCGRLAKGQSADATDLANATIALNAIVAEFQTLGMPLWARTDYSVTLVEGQRDYTLSASANTPFPLKIQTATIETTNGGDSVDLTSVAYKDFRQLNTETTGKPLNYTYQPKVNEGVLSVWPLPDATAVSAYTIKLTYQRPFSGFSTATDTPDFPQEWQNALIYALAVSMAPEYGVPLEDRKVLMAESKGHLDNALQGGGEESSLFFQPAYSRS